MLMKPLLAGAFLVAIAAAARAPQTQPATRPPENNDHTLRPMTPEEFRRT